eukprot:TRINITY_DN4212_c0_g1_i1.p1 TRINITY_DN4212_c0_g1~~TRINITY_DN4212_c0_g1_i1.p1  ORF type:complete len:335 (+),score=99.62 TRINITY_DN4212_c0_g1_i1:197-1201(+)
MQALVLTKSGHPSENFQVVNDFHKPPSPGKGDILVKVHATALNPVDYKQAQYGFLITGYPVVLGCDAAGEVVAVGEGVTRFKVGDKVCGFTTIRANYGSYAQYCLMAAYSTVHVPNGWTIEQASTIGVGAFTAAEALYRHLKLPLKADAAHPTSVLIWGGSGSVGAYAVQLAHASGFKVIATAGARNAEFVKSLGADVVVDHSDAHVVEKIVQAAGGNLTFALDTIGSETAATCLKALRKEGEAFLHTIAGTPKESPANIKVTGGMLAACVGNAEAEQFLDSIAPHLEQLANAGQLKPNEPQVLEGGLAGIPHGLQLLHDGKVSGKKLVAHVSH